MASSSNAPDQTYFEKQREALVGEIATSLENVLQNINKLNRSFEGVIAVGNEFSSVEALWSQFENVMARDSEDITEEGQDEVGGGGSQDRQLAASVETNTQR